jgi:hypothetical protein
VIDTQKDDIVDSVKQWIIRGVLFRASRDESATAIVSNTPICDPVVFCNLICPQETWLPLGYIQQICCMAVTKRSRQGEDSFRFQHLFQMTEYRLVIRAFNAIAKGSPERVEIGARNVRRIGRVSPHKLVDRDVWILLDSLRVSVANSSRSDRQSDQQTQGPAD